MTVTKPNRAARIPELDGYRAILIFLVSWYHLWQQSWWTPSIGPVSLDFLMRAGYTHVDGMVLLSAFLLFLPWARAWRDHQPLPDATDFYRRRIARVYPSYVFLLFAVLFGIALPWRLYNDVGFLFKDVAMHLTFTFNWFPDTLLATNLGVASWTLALLMQAYLLFPFVSKAAVHHPVLTIAALTAGGWGARLWCVLTQNDYNLYVNQLPAFLDVFAFGMALAFLWVYLEARPVKRPVLRQVLGTLGVAAALVLLEYLLRRQAYSGSNTNIQRWQMIRRFPFAVSYGLLLFSLPFSVKPIRFLFGNKVMQYLGSISMNYYLIHQTIFVHLKRMGFPPSVSDLPNQAGEMPWQMQYTWLSFGLSLLLAVLVTELVEKPATKWLKKHFARVDERERKRIAS